MSNIRPSLSVTYFDPEVETVVPTPSEPLAAVKKATTPKKKSASTPKRNKRSVPWFTVWRSSFWGGVSVLSVFSLYQGVQGLLGQSAAYITLSVSTLMGSFLLDRDWKKMRNK